jgi:hypothetical protein
MAEDTKGIFISYRRGDATAYAGWLADTLGNLYGKQIVFRDIDTVKAGTDFVEAIERALEACAVMLVVIGRDWATRFVERQRTGQEDYTQLEVRTGLNRDDVRVIPVLVQGASMPRANELPADLAALTSRNAIELHDTNWQSDIGHLITILDSVAGISNIYTVKHGDTGIKIARRFNTTVDVLERANPEIPDINYLLPGDEMRIPRASPPGT